MVLEVEIDEMKCNFEHCRHYEDGECLDKESRNLCLDTAMCVLAKKEFREDYVCWRSKM